MFNIPTIPVVTRTLTAATNSVTLYYSSPGGTPRHLLVRWNARSSEAMSGERGVSFRFNGDSGSNYNEQRMDGAASTATAVRASSATSLVNLGVDTGDNAPANGFSSGEILLPDALSTRSHKSVLGLAGAIEQRLRVGVGRWANTAAITSITVTQDGSGDFKTGSTFELCVVDEAFNIDEQILGSDGTFTVGSIGAADGDLVSILNARTDRGASGDGIKWELNGDTTGGNYDDQELEGANTTVTGQARTNTLRNCLPSNSISDTEAFGAAVFQFVNFSDGSNDRAGNILAGHHADSSTSEVNATSARWNNTDAITALKLSPREGTNFKTDSMLSTYAVPKNLIERQELGAAATTVTFSSIPQTYDHLELVVYGRSDEASTSETVYVDMNADTTTANYDRQLLLGTSTTVTAAQSAANRSCGRVPGNNATANVFGGGTTTIYNYTKTDRHKHRLTANGTTGGYSSAQLESTRWESTAAVTSLVLRLNDDSDFMAGSVFTLRGISATPSSSDAANINSVVIGSIAAINSIAIASIQAMNNVALATAGGGGTSYAGITWSTDDTTPASTSYGLKFGIVGAQGIVNCNDKNATGYKATYEHDGSSWSTTGNCAGTHGVAAGGGTQSAGLVVNGWDDVGGDESNVTEEYNGSSWSTGNNSVEGSAYLTGGGMLQTAQLITGGSKYSPTVRDLSMTQTYNGTNWANESVASNGAGSGTSGESAGGGLDAFLKAAGALDSGDTTSVQIFNQTGSSWTSKAAAPTARRYTGSSTDGTRVYKIGGANPNGATGWTPQGNVESWVDNTWTTENSIPAGRTGAGCGSGGLESAAGSASAIGGNPGVTDTYYIAAATS